MKVLQLCFLPWLAASIHMEALYDLAEEQEESQAARIQALEDQLQAAKEDVSNVVDLAVKLREKQITMIQDDGDIPYSGFLLLGQRVNIQSLGQKYKHGHILWNVNFDEEYQVHKRCNIRLQDGKVITLTERLDFTFPHLTNMLHDKYMTHRKHYLGKKVYFTNPSEGQEEGGTIVFYDTEVESHPFTIYVNGFPPGRYLNDQEEFIDFYLAEDNLDIAQTLSTFQQNPQIRLLHNQVNHALDQELNLNYIAKDLRIAKLDLPTPALPVKEVDMPVFDMIGKNVRLQLDGPYLNARGRIVYVKGWFEHYVKTSEFQVWVEEDKKVLGLKEHQDFFIVEEDDESEALHRKVRRKYLGQPVKMLNVPVEFTGLTGKIFDYDSTSDIRPFAVIVPIHGKFRIMQHLEEGVHFNLVDSDQAPFP